MTIRSPFFVISDFLSPLKCEELAYDCEFYEPDRDKDGAPIPSFKLMETADQVIYNKIEQVTPLINQYFDVEYRGMEHVVFEWYPTGSVGIPRCENGAIVSNRWVKNNTRDLTGVLFLSDYQDKVPFDEEFEVYGAKLEFPQHQFSFNPQRGTLVVFPSDPHFVNVTSRVLAGEGIQARIQIMTQQSFNYDPQQYQGNYLTWFASQM